MHGTASLATVDLTPACSDGSLLVVGASLGTSAAALWGPAAEHLAGRFRVVGVDLPGHGLSHTATPVKNVAFLAERILMAVAVFQEKQGQAGQPFFYAGVSVSGCIGLQLLLDAPERIAGAAIVNSAAKIGEKANWLERAAYVRQNGTKAIREASVARWFAPGFVEANPGRVAILLDSLTATDAEGYAGVCEALGDFDVRDRLGDIMRPLIVIGGLNDVATPSEQQEAIARDIPAACMKLLSLTGHLAPVEQPEKVAGLLSDFFKELANKK